MCASRVRGCDSHVHLGSVKCLVLQSVVCRVRGCESCVHLGFVGVTHMCL